MSDLLNDRSPVIPKRGMFAIGLVVLFGTAIAYNAVIGQSARHPAPLGGKWQDAAPNARKPAAPTSDAALRPRPKGLPSSAVSKTPMGKDSMAGESPTIRRLQEQLLQLGYYRGEIDGRDGDATKAAIAAYQKDRGLAVSAKVSETLMEQIAADTIFLNASRFEAESASTDAPAGQAVEAGLDPERERTRLIQKGLAELGYEPGPADGIAGQQTREAVVQFRRDRGLPPTGRLDEALLKELGKVSGLTSLQGV